MAMYIRIASVVLNFLTITTLFAVVPDSVPCVSEIEKRFFSQSIVNQALSLYNVRQELWLLINERLQQKSIEIPERLKKRTVHMVPNPIEYPMQKEITAKILKEVLFEIFIEVMQEYHVDTGSTTNLAFEYIFSKQLPAFVACFNLGLNQVP